jgi:Ca-activated chloride channel family protein
MSLLSPWLLLIGVPVLGGIIVLYLLKLRRKDLVVSSVMLWQDVTKDVQANAPFQKLRKSLLLFLQLATAALLVFALARPFVMSTGLKGESVAIILDGSASMKATDVGRSRFEAARSQALGLIDRLSRGDQAMVILAAGQTEVLAPFSADKTALRRAVSSAQPNDTATDLRDAVILAVQSTQARRSARIVLLSDGASADLDGVATGKARLEYRKIGRSGNNLGICALDVRRGFGESSGFELFCSIRNFSAEKKDAELELRLDDVLIDAQEIEIPAESTQSVVFSDFGDARGMLQVAVNAADDFAIDDVAYIDFEPKATIDVLLVTPKAGNLFLEQGLNSDARTALSKTTLESYKALAAKSDGLSQYDLIVFDRSCPDELAPGSYLIFGTTAPKGPAAATGKALNTVIVDWSQTSPLNRFVDYSEVRIAEAPVLRPASWGDVVAETESGPVIVSGERRDSKFVVVGFDVGHENSDFGLRVAFPIFLSNCITWLTSGVGFGQAAMARAGEPLLLDLPKELRRVEITKPDGSKIEATAETSPFVFARTGQTGLYTFAGDGYRASRAVNLLNSSESDIQPEDVISVGGKAISETKTARSAKLELWRYVTLAALALLCFEWYAYHRRL